MDCKRVDQELIAFHLAALDGATRAAVEAHLCACGRCVGAYLMLKRAVDVGEESPAPAEATRARLFEAARAALAPAATPAAPVATAPAVASSAEARARRAPRRTLVWATAAAAMLVAAPLIYRATAPRAPVPAVTSPAGSGEGPASPGLAPRNAGPVDTARAMPESLKYL